MLFFYGGHLVMRGKRCAVQNQGITLKSIISVVYRAFNNLCFDHYYFILSARNGA